MATPSSTTMTVRLASGVRGPPPRKRRARRSSSARSRASTAASSSSLTSVRLTRSSSMIRTPPSPMAPMASSGWKGTPSLRTTMTSSGAPNLWATSYTTETLPRKQPQDDHVLVAEALEASRQPAAGIGSVCEGHRLAFLPCHDAGQRPLLGRADGPVRACGAVVIRGSAAHRARRPFGAHGPAKRFTTSLHVRSLWPWVRDKVLSTAEWGRTPLSRRGAVGIRS